MAEKKIRKQTAVGPAKEKVLPKAVKKIINVKRKPPRGNRTKLLVSIVNVRDEVRLKSILDDCSVALGVAFTATGTARSHVLDYLGIGETEKTMVLSLFPESDEEILIKNIRTKMSLYLVGRGISFTIPLTGISEIVANGLATAATGKITEADKFMNDAERKYDLIIAAVDASYVDTAMEAARSAGAAGGTIIHARMLDNKKAQQFIGISLATEQEILLILARRDTKLAIMQTLFDRVGVKTNAGGIIFSLPVDRTVGINADESEEESGAKEDKKENAE